MSRSHSVYLYGTRVGVLYRLPDGGSAFEPDEEWVVARFDPLLGISWLQEGGARISHTESLPVWFENLLPEPESGLRQRISASLGIPPTDSFALIGEIGTDLPGAVVIRPEDSTPAPPRAPSPVEQGPASSRGPLHFSLAGMQLKFSLALRDGRLTLPLRGEQGSFIAKIPSERLAALPAVEHTTMCWARSSGLDTAQTELVAIGTIDELSGLARFPGETCLVVHRYDRTAEGAIHQEDLAQVFSVPVWNKYTDRAGPRMTAEGLVRFIRDACGPDAAEAMVRRLSFVLASGNSDAHLKNWSVVLPQRGRPRLAPLYDQVSTIVWDEYGWDRRGGPELAHPIGGSGLMAEMDQERIRAFAARAGDARYLEIFLDGLEAARDAWAAHEQGATVPHREAVRKHWARVPLLARVGLPAT